MTTMQLGWAGVGNMGVPMLQRILEGGHNVLAFDARPQALQELRPASGSVAAAASVSELAVRCDVIFLSLPTIAVVREVTHALLSSVDRRVGLVVNTGTTGALLSHELAAAAAPRGVRLVDCPVSGGPVAARAGLLSVMVSGRSSDIELLRGVLLLWGKNVTVAGETPGAAQTLKLVNNAIIVASYVSTLEAFLFGAKAGLSPQVMLDAINAGRLAHNGTTRVWLPDYILQGKPFGAQLHLLMKDMSLALAESDAQQVSMTVCAAALRVAKNARERGLDESADLMDLIKALEATARFTLPHAA